VTITATIHPQFGGMATGSVTFSDGAATLGTSPLSGNIATIPVSLSAGTHSLQASYGGDTNVASSVSSLLNQQVTKSSTSVALASSLNPALVGQSVVYTATVVPQFAGTATGTVTFKQGSAILGTVPVVAGVATFTTSYATVGTFLTKATYSGDNNFLTGSSTAVREVVNVSAVAMSLSSSVNPSFYGQSVTFMATLTTSGSSLDGQTVSFKSGSLSLGSATISGGIASISTANLAPGSRVITATYAGDTTHTHSVGLVTQVVQKATTTTVVTADVNPSAAGQAVTFTATVSSANAVPTGTVKFKDGATLLGTSTLSGGIATLVTTTLTSGTHSITALYVPPANFTTSSGSMTQTVQ
jgi:hypothetical protein